MESGNGVGNAQNSVGGGGPGVAGFNNPTGRASITIPLAVPSSSSSASPSPRLNASVGSLHYLIAEATRFSSDIKRLTGELAEAKQRIAVQDEEMAQLQDQVHVQSVQLSEAAEIMTEQQNKIAELEEEKQSLEGCNMDTKELKKMVAFERNARILAEEKLQKMKESMKSINGEFQHFLKEIKGNIHEEDGTSSSSSSLAVIGSSEVGEVAPQNKLDRLSECVQDKFDTWTTNQMKLKTEVISMNGVIQKLAKCLQTKQGNVSVTSLQQLPSLSLQRAASGKRQQKSAQSGEGSLVSAFTASSPPSPGVVDSLPAPPPSLPKTPTSSAFIQVKEENPPPPNTLPGNAFHAEDFARFSQGFFCICGTDYSSHSNLRIHVRTFTEEGKFKCSICKQRFVLFYMLRRHQKDKHKISNGKSVGCSVCGKDFSSFACLYKHRNIAHARVSLKNRKLSSPKDSSWSTQEGFYDEGDDDDIVFLGTTTAASAVETTAPPPNSNLNDTDEAEENERPINYFGKKHGLDVAQRLQGFFCICGSQLLNRRKLDIHVRRSNQQELTGGVINYAEDDNIDDFYDDEEEEEQVDGEEVQENDEELEEEEQQIDEEDGLNSTYGSTISISGIHRHQHKHGAHPTNPLECICGYVATVKGNYTKHLAYYTMERKFACQICSQRFINTTYLKQHMVRKHNVNVDEIKKIRTGCSKCGKTFQSMKAFRQHDRIAHGSKVIGRKIRSSRSTRNGFRRRSSKGQVVNKGRPSNKNSRKRRPYFSSANSSLPGKKFACEHCDASFASLHQLLRHKKAAHGIIHQGFAIGCKDCGIAFTTRIEHVRHRITVHNSLFGRNRRRVVNTETDPPMPKLKNEERSWVPTTGSPPSSPHPIPISIDDEDGSAPSRNVDNEVPSSSLSAAAAQYEFDEEDADESQNNKQLHAVDSTKENQGNFCICGSDFNEKKNLFCHIRRHTEKWRFQCSICKKLFYYNSAMKRHMLYTHKVKNIYSRNKRVGCVVCGETFGTWFALRQHAKNSHSSKPDAGEEPQSRSSSRSSSRNASPRKKPTDQQEAEKPRHGKDTSAARLGHYCLCGKDFSSEKTLSVHIKYQTRERTVPCPICNQLFICQSYMKQHVERSHKKLAPTTKTFRCRKCSKSFESNVELLSHSRTAHKTNQSGGVERTSRTARSLAAFRQRRKNAQIPLDIVAVHEPVAGRGSSGTLKCSCGREYLSKSSLHKHIRIQSEGKVFQCQLCPKEFAEHGSLKVHVRKTHQVEYQNSSHGCGICAQIFPTHGQVVKHRIQVHGRAR